MGYISKTSTLNVPDYVFEDDYPLGTLAELRAFIDTHKHLPNVTSAAKIAHAGMRLGASQLQLLEKVEETTLHLLDQHRRLRLAEGRGLARLRELAEKRRRLAGV